MKQGRETTQEERIRIARECIAEGRNYGAMALTHKVSYQQVLSWTLRYEEMGDAGLEDRRGRRKKSQTPRNETEQAQIENEQLKHRLYLAEMELALLKKRRSWEGGTPLGRKAGASLPRDQKMPQGRWLSHRAGLQAAPCRPFRLSQVGLRQTQPPDSRE